MADKVTITGLDDMRKALSELPKQLRNKVLLGALRKAARVPLQIARQSVPVMSAADAAKNPYRTAGLLKKRLTVRTSRESRRAGNIGVFVNIKPADKAKFKTTTNSFLGVKIRQRSMTKASQRGAKSPFDPFYWRFVEFGTKKMKARPFMQPAADSLPKALEVFNAEVIPQIEKYNRRK
jgi:HK97 gp10 family phage protein